MAINFPDIPTHGNTYSYLNINYTFINPDPAEVGYWAVVDPAALSAATSADIDAGTSNDRYNTPQALNGSKYVREDEASGETVLNHNGAERLKTTAQGVVVTGQIDINGQGNIGPYVLERGSNSLGSWERWSDGFIKCWGKGNLDSDVLTGFAFPVTFLSVPHVMISTNQTSATRASYPIFGIVATETRYTVKNYYVGGNLSYMWQAQGY